jgi:hypothetical protein
MFKIGDKVEVFSNSYSGYWSKGEILTVTDLKFINHPEEPAIGVEGRNKSGLTLFQHYHPNDLNIVIDN